MKIETLMVLTTCLSLGVPTLMFGRVGFIGALIGTLGYMAYNGIFQ